MKNRGRIFSIAVALVIAVSGMFIISACGSSSGSFQENYDRGYQIGSALRQIMDGE